MDLATSSFLEQDDGVDGDPFSALPDDVLVAILSFVACENEASRSHAARDDGRVGCVGALHLARACLASRRFCQLGSRSDLWKPLLLTRFGDPFLCNISFDEQVPPRSARCLFGFLVLAQRRKADERALLNTVPPPPPIPCGMSFRSLPGTFDGGQFPGRTVDASLLETNMRADFVSRGFQNPDLLEKCDAGTWSHASVAVHGTTSPECFWPHLNAANIRLPEVARALLGFLSQNLIYGRPDESLWRGLLRRYEDFFELLVRYPEADLVPDAGCELVWISHMLRPSRYSQDCSKMARKTGVTDRGPVRHCLYASEARSFTLPERAALTQRLWAEHFDGEKFFSCKLPAAEDAQKPLPFSNCAEESIVDSFPGLGGSTGAQVGRFKHEGSDYDRSTRDISTSRYVLDPATYFALRCAAGPLDFPVSGEAFDPSFSYAIRAPPSSFGGSAGADSLTPPILSTDENWSPLVSLTAEELIQDFQWLAGFGKYLRESGVEPPNFRAFDDPCRDDPLFTNLETAYQRFLFLSVLALERGHRAPLHPSYAVDLCWHAHMICPREYLQDSLALCGGLLDHDPWPDKVLQKDVDVTRIMWEKQYGTKLDAEHTWGLQKTAPPQGHPSPFGVSLRRPGPSAGYPS